MVNIKKNSCPIGYKKKMDQVISNPAARTATGACTWSGPSIKLVNACIDQLEPQAPSNKLQAASSKQQA